MGVYQDLGDACIHCKVKAPSRRITKDLCIYTHFHKNLKFNMKLFFLQCVIKCQDHNSSGAHLLHYERSVKKTKRSSVPWLLHQDSVSVQLTALHCTRRFSPFDILRLQHFDISMTNLGTRIQENDSVNFIITYSAIAETFVNIHNSPMEWRSKFSKLTVYLRQFKQAYLKTSLFYRGVYLLCTC